MDDIVSLQLPCSFILKVKFNQSNQASITLSFSKNLHLEEPSAVTTVTGILKSSRKEVHTLLNLEDFEYMWSPLGIHHDHFTNTQHRLGQPHATVLDYSICLGCVCKIIALLHITICILDPVRIFILSPRCSEIIKMLCFDK